MKRFIILTLLYVAIGSAVMFFVSCTSEGKLIGYGQLKPEQMVMREGIIPGPPHILILNAPLQCKHIYVAVEPERVKVAKGSVILTTIGGGDTKGKSIVCLKCQHVTNQVIDYTEPVPSMLIMPSFGQGSGGITELDTTIGNGQLRLSGAVQIWPKNAIPLSDSAFNFWMRFRGGPIHEKGRDKCNDWHIADGFYYQCNPLRH